jgi:hypothetical protein
MVLDTMCARARARHFGLRLSFFHGAVTHRISSKQGVRPWHGAMYWTSTITCRMVSHTGKSTPFSSSPAGLWMAPPCASFIRLTPALRTACHRWLAATPAKHRSLSRLPLRSMSCSYARLLPSRLSHGATILADSQSHLSSSCFGYCFP